MSALQTNILSVNVPQLSEPGSLYIIGHIISIQNKTNTSQHTASHLRHVRRHTVVPSWQNTKCALVSHTLQTAECRSQCVWMTQSCAHSPERRILSNKSHSMTNTTQSSSSVYKKYQERLSSCKFLLQKQLEDAIIISWNMYVSYKWSNLSYKQQSILHWITPIPCCMKMDIDQKWHFHQQ